MAKETNMDAVVRHSDTSPESMDAPGKQQPKDSDGQPSSKPEGDVKHYNKLHRAATEGDWNAAKKIIEDDEKALTARISLQGMTALHVAARNGQLEFVERLVDMLTADDLATRDNYGRNALHYIATVGTVRAAQKMVEKNEKLPQQMDKQGHTPIFAAVLLGLPQRRWEMIKYLAGVTKDEDPSFTFTGYFSGDLILGIVASGYYDIALDLINKYSNLALPMNEDKETAMSEDKEKETAMSEDKEKETAAMNKDEETILHVIAKDPSAFGGGRKISFWEGLLYPRATRNIEQNARQVNLQSLLEKVCGEVLKLDNEKMQEYVDSFTRTMHLAIKNGLVELVKKTLEYFPDILWLAHDGKLLLHVAIEHRRHNVFNYLIKLTGERKFAFSNVVEEESGNNILHLAAILAPFDQLYYVSGTALQMQRELQWFKEVEKLVHSTSRWDENIKGKTPQQLFTEQHRKLQEDGEEWLKDTAQNCMVVATLVATIVFAAIITVPGGMRGETGTPVFLRKIPFIVFIIADGLAVFSSMTSLLVFLSILSSRYAEEDFLKSLPLKLVGGLSFLLMAIVTMTIAFAAALQIAVHSKFRLSYIFSIFLGCVPVALFLRLHLPLFLQVVKSTCGPGIFEQNDRKHWWTKLWHMETKEQILV